MKVLYAHPMTMALTVHPTLVPELMMGGATLIMLWGMWLCWSAQNHRMLIEEGVKDGKITADDAHRKIRRRHWIGPGLTVLGVGWLVVAITR